MHHDDNHNRNSDDRDAPRRHPLDFDPRELCAGCPDCDAIAGEFISGLELDLRHVSLDLWVAGWTPSDLSSQIRRDTGLVGSVDLVAHLLIVDDSHRSDQARPTAWTAAIAQLKAQTGINDCADGWLARWIAAHDDVGEASRCLHETIRALGEIVDPRVVA